MEILVYYSKHSTDFYDASTDEALAKSALHIIKIMGKEGYYPEPSDPRESKWNPLNEGDNLTDEQIAALPNDTLRLAATHARKMYRGRLGQYKRELAEWNELQRIIREEDASVKHEPFVTSQGKEKVRKIIPAWDLLYARTDYEYERVELATVWSADS